MPSSTGASQTGSDLDALGIDVVSRMLRSAFITLWITGALCAVVGVVANDEHAIWGGASLFCSAPGLLGLLRSGRVQAALTGSSVLILVIGTTLAVTGHGIHDIAIIVFPGVIIFSSLLLHRNSSLAVTILSMLALGGLGVGEASRMVQTSYSREVMYGDVALQVLILGAMGWLMRTLSGALYKSLRDAHDSEQTYREIFDAANDAIYVHDPKTGAVIDVNEQASRQTGFSRQRLLALTLADIGFGIDGQGEARARELMRKAVHEGPQVFEWTPPAREGRQAYMEVSLRLGSIRGESRVLATVRDISDRKAAADRALAEERLEAVGQLAGGIAHDFNNQLTAMLTNVSILRTHLKNDADVVARLETVAECGSRSAELIRQLLAFARKHQTITAPLDLNALINEVAALLVQTSPEGVTIKKAFSAEPVWVNGDAGLLHHALLNLGVNACDAMALGGQLSFGTEFIAASNLPRDVQERIEQPEGHYVKLTVHDTGSGISSDSMAHIFEPFFTTKPLGNGMGLAATYGTVHAHRGAIVVDSIVGSGTTFKVFLPTTEERAPRRASTTPESTLTALTVLLAEDDIAVAKGTSEILRCLGCEVHHYEDGQAALDAFERNPEGYDVALLDNAMPRMTGTELALLLRRRRPNLPIVATSGFGEEWHAAKLGEHCLFLPKPFDMDALREAIAQVTQP